MPGADRFDPIALLEEQNEARVPDLVPVRHGRMMVSPFTFYRGSAKIMAADLEHTPRAGLMVQLCGDAHLSNFGAFASPERQLLFDLNDFDETLPGPFEYDVKRLAASFTIAARNNGFGKADARDATLAAVRGYRETMAEFAEMSTMDVWYAHLSETTLMAAIESFAAASTDTSGKKASKKKQKKAKAKAEATAPKKRTTENEAKRARKLAEKARTRDSLQALSKLGEVVDGEYRIISQPPIVVPMRDLEGRQGMSAEQFEHMVHEQLRAYRASLQDDRRHLLERFQFVDMAHKVVGVGSVGARAFIVLLQGRDQKDPLFLQVKEATASVLEDHLPKSRYKQPGERVVQGQRLMQAASDIYLGWTKGPVGKPLPLLAPAPGHEGLGRRRIAQPCRSRVLRPLVRMDARPCARSLRRSNRDRHLPWRERCVRQVGHRLRRALRRSERAGLRGFHQSDRFGTIDCERRPLTQLTITARSTREDRRQASRDQRLGGRPFERRNRGPNSREEAV